jgi:hypothetical protein
MYRIGNISVIYLITKLEKTGLTAALAADGNRFNLVRV